MKSILFFILISLLQKISFSTIYKDCSLNENIVNLQILQKQTVSCMQKALKNNWSNVIDYLVKQKQNQFQEQFIKVFQNQIKRLEILQQEIIVGTTQTQPIMKWGQNKTHLFITFKLSHRWDSPPCLYTQFENYQLNSTNFFYINVCLVSQQKVSFKVNMTLFKNIVNEVNDSSHITTSNYQDYKFEVKKDGVGTYSTILLKQTPQIWLFLTKKQVVYQNWYQISTRYPEDNREYERNLQNYKEMKRKLNQNSSSQSYQ